MPPRTRVSPPSPAAGHRRTRQDHAREVAEDYVEAIAELVEIEGKARVTAIAQRLGVSHVTVIRALARLAKGGLVVVRPYRPVELTAAGRKLAAAARRRHEVVLGFLRALGVDEATARSDAEGLEHHLSEQTLDAMERFVAEGRGGGARSGKSRPARG